MRKFIISAVLAAVLTASPVMASEVPVDSSTDTAAYVEEESGSNEAVLPGDESVPEQEIFTESGTEVELPMDESVSEEVYTETGESGGDTLLTDEPEADTLPLEDESVQDTSLPEDESAQDILASESDDSEDIVGASGFQVSIGNEKCYVYGKLPSVTVTYKGKKLVKDKDYILFRGNNYVKKGNVYEDDLAVLGKGKYSSFSETKKYLAYAADITNSVSVSTGSPSYSYTGWGRQPKPIVVYKKDGLEVPLERGVDYTFSYAKNLNVDTATITIKGKGKFKGTASCTFQITPLSLSKAKAATKSKSYVYTGYARKPIPVVTVQSGDKTLHLVNGKDFTVSYKNNKNAGTATAIVTGKGNFKGTCSCTFRLTPLTLNRSTTSAKTRSASYVYSNSYKKPNPLVKYKNGNSQFTLVMGKDYTLSYKNNKNAGTATVTVTGKGNFKGSVSTTFRITPKSIKNFKVKFNGGTRGPMEYPVYEHTGKAVKPSFVLKDPATGVTLKEGRDYTVTYRNNVKQTEMEYDMSKGMMIVRNPACAVIKGKGNYKDSCTGKFVIDYYSHIYIERLEAIQ